MHTLMLLAVLLNLILPLSGLLYDNHMEKSEPGWRFGGLMDFLKRESTTFYVGTLSAHVPTSVRMIFATIFATQNTRVFSNVSDVTLYFLRLLKNCKTKNYSTMMATSSLLLLRRYE